jgi:hypothetical protein
MSIEWSATAGYYVKGRANSSKFAQGVVDSTTVTLQQRVPSALGQAESAFKPNLGHEKLGSMRAHHVGDHVIQQAICDYLNAGGGPSAFAEMLNKIGTLYQTSWIDLVVTQRIAVIWGQWVHALGSACLMAFKQVVGTEQEIARSASDLARVLSSSVSNLRIGQAKTDHRLGDAIAPRIRNGEVIFDLPFLFASWASGQLPALREPTLSFETTLVAQNWTPDFLAHPFRKAEDDIVINNVFVANKNREIFISERGPLIDQSKKNHKPPLAKIAADSIHNYPGTDGWGLHVQRIGRAFLHVLPLVVTGYFILGTATNLGSSIGLADLLSYAI